MTGYNALAKFIARFPEHSIFRKFGALSAKRLLYMQAELSHLERELQLIEEYDQNDHATFASSWIQMNEASDENDASFQREKMLEISEKLDKYRQR